VNGKNLQELIKNLQVFYTCPSCGEHYRNEDIAFLGRVDEHCFMQLTCKSCSLPILATVLLAAQLEQSAKATSQTTDFVQKQRRRFRSDLRRGEKARFSGSEAITGDEVADLHLYLSNNSTDLHSHF
jgi:hypothetical protein